MRNKIFTILGILIVILSVGAYFLFSANVKNNSEAMGINVLVAQKDIPEGTVIKNTDQAAELFSVRKMAQAEAVENAATVNAVNLANPDLFSKIKNYFVPQGYEASLEDLKGLVNKKVTRDYLKNEQISGKFLSNDIIEFADDERLFAVPTTYTDSVGAEVKMGDYVDLWINYGDKHARAGKSEIVAERLRVVKIKDGNNVEITDGKEIPKLVVFKLDEDSIAKISELSLQGAMFLTKYGVTPTAPAKAE